jgi:hypothetical protein
MPWSSGAPVGRNPGVFRPFPPGSISIGFLAGPHGKRVCLPARKNLPEKIMFFALSG